MSEAVTDLLAYLDASPSPYHAVAQTILRLEAAGFRALDERDAWRLTPGDRVWVTRGDSSIVAFVIGSEAPHGSGFLLIGAHTDSPNLRVKPQADVTRHGYRQLAVETYGGLLLSTWLDRDLSAAGRVMVSGGRGQAQPHLVDLKRPLLRIPNLAIHLNRELNEQGLQLNKQRHMVPMLGLERDGYGNFRTLLAEALAGDGVSCSADDILGWDIGLYDTQGAALAGHEDAFLHSARLDNLASCHAALDALLGTADVALAATRGIALYDHEEVGSRSAQGADSAFLSQLLQRIAGGLAAGAEDAMPRALARSFLVSADMAHAVHPNYPERHEPGHRPLLGGGPVIKRHVSQAYATDGESEARFAGLCQQSGVPVQHFVSRSDLACGSTIGPITAAQLGIRTIDVGNPLLSMHSIREMAATADIGMMQKALRAHFSPA